MREEAVDDGLPLVDVTLKLPLVDAVPPGVVTEIGPSVAPAGTLAMICVPVPLTKKGVPVPLNCTALAPAKFAPLIVTLVPTGPLVGLNPVKLGGVPAAAGKRRDRDRREPRSPRTPPRAPTIAFRRTFGS